jgi:uncharacterized protein involved in exopolysaccharide biosynthesis
MNSHPDGLAISDIVALLRRQRRILLAGIGLAIIAVAAWRFLSPARYSASGSFAAQYHGVGGALGGLASQLGVEIASDPSQSPAFYADLLATRTVRLQLLESYVRAPTARDSMPLVDVLVPPGSLSRDERLERGVQKLSKIVTTGVSVRTGVVWVQATTNERWLSPVIVNKLIRMVDNYNQRVRRSAAKSEREFISRRVDELRDEWSGAQARLARFNESNRDLRSSPEKAVERERLLTDVRLKQEAFSMTTSALEQARIEEVRNTPAVTILEDAGTPLRAQPRRYWVPLFLSLVATLAAAWSHDWWQSRKRRHSLA